MEMLRLLSGLPQNFSPKIYVIAKTDSKSINKILDFEKNMKEKHEGMSKVIDFSYAQEAYTSHVDLYHYLFMIFSIQMKLTFTI